MYQVRILEPAARELGTLEKQVGARIVKRVHWLAENLDFLKPQP